MNLAKGALDNLRVIDATQMLAGPIAGTRLGDLGAPGLRRPRGQGPEPGR